MATLDYIIKIKRKKSNLLHDRWIWKLAYHDARKNFSRLFLFISSIVIGVAALVAIESFNFNLQDDIDHQAKELLGADLAVHSHNEPFNQQFLSKLDSLIPGVNSARDARFASMVYFPKNQGTRLIQVVAIKGAYPFYGNIELTPGSDIEPFREGKAVLIDENLAIQYDIHPGDSLKLGKSIFYISGLVQSFPGNTDISATIAPSVYLPYSKLQGTGLIQFGSRVSYNRYYMLGNQDEKKVLKALGPLTEQYRYSYETVASRKRNMGNTFENLYRFFNLLSFVALILGCIGVASSIYIYVREKQESAAILRCLGASGWQVFYVFFVQVAVLGIIGSVIGVLHGIAVQYLLPYVVSDFLPIDVNIKISWIAVFEGLGVGLVISLLFSILPLTRVRLIPPLLLLRSAFEQTKRRSRFTILMFVLTAAFLWFFAYYQTNSLINGSIFFAGLLVVFGLLYVIGWLLIYLVRRFFPSNFNFVWRQSLSNLFRPNNQTIVLVVVIGLGAFLLSTMALIQNSLLNQVEFAGSGERSNTVLFDIQPTQRAGVTALAKSYDLPIQQLVPIVTTRIKSVRGIDVKTLKNDTTQHIRHWALEHEYRVTYRDSLIASEKIVQGKFMHTPATGDDSVFISVADNMQEGLKLKLKDQIVFDVQGVPVTTYVGSIRKVDWRRIQTNFMVVFPDSVLESAPQFFVLVTRIKDKNKSAMFQQELVHKFPNVSAIDLTLILETLDNIFDKISFVIRFMALFSVITGLLVLSGAVINSKYARLRENVLLRTLGAVKKQLVGMTLIEYGYLGLFAALAGTLLSLGSSWALSAFFFDILFFPDFLSLMVIWLIIAGLTVLVGWFNTRSILNRSPLEVLRKEV